MYKLRKTTKLHYGKYLYKATFRNQIAFLFSGFRNKSSDRLSYARATLSDLQQKKAIDVNYKLSIDVWRTTKTVSDEDFYYSKKILDCLEKCSDWRVRVENSRHLTIYTSNPELIKDLEVGCNVKEIYKPEDGTEDFLISNINTVVVKSPSKYQYRIYLKGNAIDPNFANWLTANEDKSKVGEWTLRNIREGWYNSGNYFYVTNDKVLTMIRMLIGHNIRKIEKLVYKGDIDKYTYDN